MFLKYPKNFRILFYVMIYFDSLFNNKLLFLTSRIGWYTIIFDIFFIFYQRNVSCSPFCYFLMEAIASWCYDFSFQINEVEICSSWTLTYGTRIQNVIDFNVDQLFLFVYFFNRTNAYFILQFVTHNLFIFSICK